MAFPSSSLVHYFKLEGDGIDNTGGCVDNVGSIIGDVIGATKETSGKINSCLHFDASDDEIKLPASSSVMPSGDFSISCWCWFEGYSWAYDRTVFAAFGGASLSSYFKIYASISGDELALRTDAGDKNFVLNPSESTWYHIAVTYDASTSTLTGYLDGTSTFTTTENIDFTGGSYEAYVGAYSSGNSEMFGRIDEFGIWDRELTSTEVSDLYNSGNGETYDVDSIPTSSLVGHWNLEGDATDVVNSNDGTVSGATLISDGVQGSAYDFDGTDDYISIPNDATLNFGSGNFSINVWIRSPSEPSSDSRIINKGNSTSGSNCGDGKRYEIYTKSGINFVVDDDSTKTNEQWNPTSGLWDDDWHMLTAVRNGTSNILYCDATQVGVTTGGTGDIDGTCSLLFGNGRMTGDGIEAPADINIDQVSMYNRALTTSELHQLYNGGIPVSYAGGGGTSSVNQDLIDAFTLYNLINQDVIGAYSLFNHLNDDLTDAYSIFNAVNDEFVDAYGLRESVNDDIVDQFGILNTTLQNLTDAYSLFNTVNDSFADAYSLFNNVNQDFIDAWNLKEGIDQNVTGAYSILNVVNDNFADAYDVLNVVNDDFVDAYKLKNVVNEDFVDAYSVIAQVYQDFVDAYGVAQSLSQVYNDIKEAYTLYNVVNHNVVDAYSIKNVVYNQIVDLYELRELINRDILDAFGLSGQVFQDVKDAYALLTTVNETLTDAYAILNVLNQDVVDQYALKELIAQDIVDLYTISGQLVSSVTLKTYDITNALNSMTSAMSLKCDDDCQDVTSKDTTQNIKSGKGNLDLKSG